MYYLRDTTTGAVFRSSHPEYHTGSEVIPAKVGAAEYRRQYVASLRETIRPNQVVYTILRSVSVSGMSRTLSVVTVGADGQIHDITGCVAVALDDRTTDRGHIRVGGCGFDAGFDVVYRLGRTIWPDGTPEPHGTRNGQPDSDGGYALTHRWL